MTIDPREQDDFSESVSDPVELDPSSRDAPSRLDDHAVGLYDQRGPKPLEVEDIARIVQARTGVPFGIDDPIMVELVALDTAMRHYSGENAKLVTMHGELLDRQADKISETVGERIDMFAEAAVAAIKENSATMKSIGESAAESVAKAESTMLAVTATAKVLLAITAGVAAVTITALVGAAFYILAGRL